jgi:LDH2 family malate/lactate/ureidoglycolate dehydrogenase
MLDRFKVPDNIAVRVAPGDMRTTVENLFTALGMPEDDAVQAADVLIYADVRGIDSHGVSNMTRFYVAGFQGGHINPTPERRITRDAGASVTVDCDKGLGLAVGPPVMDLAIERARQFGVGVAIAFNAAHYGPSAYHAHRALPHDMIGMSMTSGGVQSVPTHGAEPLVGLNPIGIAVPAGEEVPYIFDASMSAVAGNKIRLLQRVGGEVLPGWVTEADGTPVMEEAPVPDDFMMLPLGGTREITQRFWPRDAGRGADFPACRHRRRPVPAGRISPLLHGLPCRSVYGAGHFQSRHGSLPEAIVGVPASTGRAQGGLSGHPGARSRAGS